MNRVFVTGAAGHLGRAVVAHLRAAGVDTVGLDRVPGSDLVGDVTDPSVLAVALAGCDAVVHLAAIPSPTLGTPEQVFGRNSLGTFAVLEAAAQAGVRRAMIASSMSVLGLAFAPGPRVDPVYLPIDEDHPLLVADPYALSKQADEATAAMMARRYGMTAIAVRFPRLVGPEFRLVETVRKWTEDPADGAREFWAYLDYRDAARVTEMALTAPVEGYHRCQVAAPETLSARPTAALLDEFYPHVPRRRALGRWEVPFDLRRAAEVLGFAAIHLYEPEHAC